MAASAPGVRAAGEGAAPPPLTAEERKRFLGPWETPGDVPQLKDMPLVRREWIEDAVRIMGLPAFDDDGYMKIRGKKHTKGQHGPMSYITPIGKDGRDFEPQTQMITSRTGFVRKPKMEGTGTTTSFELRVCSDRVAVQLALYLKYITEQMLISAKHHGHEKVGIFEDVGDPYEEIANKFTHAWRVAMGKKVDTNNVMTLHPYSLLSFGPQWHDLKKVAVTRMRHAKPGETTAGNTTVKGKFAFDAIDPEQYIQDVDGKNNPVRDENGLAYHPLTVILTLSISLSFGAKRTTLVTMSNVAIVNVLKRDGAAMKIDMEHVDAAVMDEIDRALNENENGNENSPNPDEIAGENETSASKRVAVSSEAVVSA